MALPLIPADEKTTANIFSELGINEDRHKRILQVFKDWLRAETYLPNDMDDTYLSNYLILCKDDLVKAKNKFPINIISRKDQLTLNHSSFIPADYFIEYQISRRNIPVPTLTEGGYRVVYSTFPKAPQHYDVQNILKHAGILLDILLLKDTMAGVVSVTDFANCNAEIMAKVDVVAISSFINFLHQGVPTRIKNFHMLNVSSVAKPFVALVKAVLPEKIKKRFLIHDKVEHLSNFLPIDMIPVDYGGTLSSLDDLAKDWENYYLQNEEWRSELRKLTLRGIVPKEKLHLDPSYGFGTDGTFRNLQLD